MHSIKDIKHCDGLLDSLENGQIIIDQNFIVTAWNRWLCINTQISKEMIIGKSLKDFFPDINYKILARKIKTALVLNSPSFYDAQNRNNYLLPIKREKISGNALNMMQQQVTISPCKYAEGIVMISIYDVSELFETKICLQQEIEKVEYLNEQLRTQHNITDQNIMIVRISIKGIILDASTLFCELFGYKKSFLIGHNISLLSEAKMSHTKRHDIYRNIFDKKNWYGEIENTMSNGQTKWTQARITPILDENEEILSFNIVYHDITNKKLLEELYVTDPLTQIHNRGYFDSIMNRVSKYQRKEDINFILLMADIDHFKSINDTYGHQIGDDALKSFALTLKTSLRDNDLVARWGGEEFIIMLKNIDIPTAKVIAEKLRMNIENSVINDNLKLTASFGLTKYHPGEKIQESFKRVDKALYMAKENGRNQVITIL